MENKGMHSLRSVEADKYLSNIRNDGTEGMLRAVAGAKREWETFDLFFDAAANKYAIQFKDGGKYLCYDENEKKWIANRDAPGAWETFEFVALEGDDAGKIAIKSSAGTFLCSDNTAVTETYPREAQGPWERWELVGPLTELDAAQ